MIGYDEERKTYYVQIKVKDPITGKWHTKKKRGFKLKREAVAYEAQLKLELGANNSNETGMTFKEALHMWEDNNQASAYMRRKHESHLKARFKEYYDQPLKSITKKKLIRWRADLATMNEFKTSTRNLTLNIVKSVFSFISNTYDIPNPTNVLAPLKKTDDEVMEEKVVMTPEQFELFLSFVDIPIYKIYFETLFWTGCRRGEAIALQCDDLDGDALTISHSQRTHKEGLKPTKTKQKRTIALDENLSKHLNELKDNYKTGYLFGGECSLNTFSISKYFSRARNKAGLSKKITVHSLRHSHATFLINSGVNIVSVSKRLGHANVNTTLKTYTHLLERTDDDMMNFINDFRKKK